ncbi:hypothetical protein EMCG_02697 [[Emmonsia] crescens]|uniref:Uncharacterized protein n=1 Tax=[Emmonsia] crescens TaxID=73230 RepID=A0A0G2HYU9_9EURO|nr:hypothetical protein EMCG_02697 [Emmonsia crescens UAMH 3008]
MGSQVRKRAAPPSPQVRRSSRTQKTRHGSRVRSTRQHHLNYQVPLRLRSIHTRCGLWRTSRERLRDQLRLIATKCTATVADQPYIFRFHACRCRIFLTYPRSTRNAPKPRSQRNPEVPLSRRIRPSDTERLLPVHAPTTHHLTMDRSRVEPGPRKADKIAVTLAIIPD